MNSGEKSVGDLAEKRKTKQHSAPQHEVGSGVLNDKRKKRHGRGLWKDGLGRQLVLRVWLGSACSTTLNGRCAKVQNNESFFEIHKSFLQI